MFDVVEHQSIKPNLECSDLLELYLSNVFTVTIFSYIICPALLSLNSWLFASEAQAI